MASSAEFSTSPLTEERIRFVVAEHQRLMRKLKRMPAANVMLAPDRLPDLAAGETVEDIVRPQIDKRVAAVMRDIEALRSDYMRVQGIYQSVVWLGVDDAVQDARARSIGADSPSDRGTKPWDAMTGTPPTEDEVRAVAACLDDIERAEPRLKRVRQVADARRR